MKKVLILSYYFPPCNLTAAQRVGSWEKFLPEFGFYPIVVTRNWTGRELSEAQRLENSYPSIEIVQNPKSEVHYLPYSPNFRDHAFIKGQTSIAFRYISKFLTSFQLILQNFTINVIPYNNMYYRARDIISKNPDIKFLLISGNPFEQFYFGYLLKKEFPYIKWIADYRDEWTTSEIIEFKGLKKWLWDFQQIFEKKWISTANLITANTNYACKKLNFFHQKKTNKLLNGFDFELTNQIFSPTFDSLKIVHNGTLYPTQDISLLAEALSEIDVPNNFNIELYFPGIKIDQSVAEKTEKLFKNSKAKTFMTDRVSKDEVLKIQMNADLLLMIAHNGKKGIIGSKLYEYIGLQKRILLCPSDNDELEETILKTNLGIVVSEKDKLKSILLTQIEEKIKFGILKTDPNLIEVNKSNRKNQAILLAQYLNDLA